MLSLQPHRLERYLRSTDPDFELKAADVIGLYLDPPQHAAVFSVDEKTAIQALDRLDPVLPFVAGRHGFEYYLHGTLSLYAALNTRTGAVIGQTAPRHTSEDFLAYLAQVVDTQPGGSPKPADSSSGRTIKKYCQLRRSLSEADAADEKQCGLWSGDWLIAATLGGGAPYAKGSLDSFPRRCGTTLQLKCRTLITQDSRNTVRRCYGIEVDGLQIGAGTFTVPEGY